MAEPPVHAASYEVVCPHCGKAFQSGLIDGASARHKGFKCPHCRLFVPLDRAGEQELAQPAE